MSSQKRLVRSLSSDSPDFTFGTTDPAIAHKLFGIVGSPALRLLGSSLGPAQVSLRFATVAPPLRPIVVSTR